VLTLAEAAEYLRLPEDAVRQEAESGRLIGRDIDGNWRFLRERVDAWSRELQPVIRYGGTSCPQQ
jgi:excisionase family DNA binding protein